jgi:hypothetical protein
MSIETGQSGMSGARSKQRAARSIAPLSASAQREPTITREQIARRAYEIWQARGCPHGRDIDHWLEAERQLRSRQA